MCSTMARRYTDAGESCRRGGAHPALPSSLATQCAHGLTEDQKPLGYELERRYVLDDYAAKQASQVLHRELMDVNPSAARSLGAGMDETLTGHRLHIPSQIPMMLHNRVSLLSRGTRVRQCERWHGDDQGER
jgi:hypothetical protein